MLNCQCQCIKHSNTCEAAVICLTWVNTVFPGTVLLLFAYQRNRTNTLIFIPYLWPRNDLYSEDFDWKFATTMGAGRWLICQISSPEFWGWKISWILKKVSHLLLNYKAKCDFYESFALWIKDYLSSNKITPNYVALPSFLPSFYPSIHSADPHFH